MSSASFPFKIDLLGDKCEFGINVDLRRDARLAANLAAWATPGKVEAVCSSIMASDVRLFYRVLQKICILSKRPSKLLEK